MKLAQVSRWSANATTSLRQVGYTLSTDFKEAVLRLHSATEIKELWEATSQVIYSAVPSTFNCLCLRPYQLTPGTVFRDRYAFKDSAELKRFNELSIMQAHIAAHPGITMVRLSDIMSDASLSKTPFYTECMKPCNFRRMVALVFWEGNAVAGVVCLHRATELGDFTRQELDFLDELHPQFSVAIHRVVKLHRERLVRLSLEKFMQFLPLPTVLLNWDLQPIYQNHAALQLSLVWEHGPERARSLKPPVQFETPADLRACCERLRAGWNDPHPQNFNLAMGRTEIFRHSERPELNATVALLQFSAAPSQRPVFLIQFENPSPARPARRGDADNPALNRLHHLSRLTPSEQELALLVCQGESNKEIAGRLFKSPLTVKKQMQSIFRKLEVPSRSRLSAILR